MEKLEDKARHHFSQGLETALAEYVLCEVVAAQGMIKDSFPTTLAACCCVFLAAVSSPEFLLCQAYVIHVRRELESKEEIWTVC